MKHCVWRLLTAIFILLVALLLGLMSVLFQGVALMMGIGFYGMLILFPWGFIKGVLAILDYHKTVRREE